MIGDVNGDGKVDIIDGLLVIQYYVGLNPAGFNSSAGDVNQDGSIDIIDGLLILQSIAGEIHIPTAPTPMPVPGAGTFTLALSSPSSIVGDDVIVYASLDTGDRLCAAYSLVITYPTALLSYSSIEAGTDGFVSVVNASTAGMIVVSGFDVMGKGPGTIQLLRAIFIANGPGTAEIVLTPEQLIDVNTYSIGTPGGASVQVMIEEGEATPIPTPAPTGTPVTETTAPTAAPAETTGPTPGNIPGAGNVWFEPAAYNVNVGDNFDTYIRANTGDQVLGAYSFEITFDGAILSVNVSLGSGGVDTDGSGFVTAGNTPGFIKIAGYDTSGKAPGTNLAVVTIHWTAIGAGTSSLTTVVTDFVALGDYTIIGAPNASNGSVIVTGIPGGVTPPPVEPTPPPVEPTEPPVETPNATPDAEPTPIAEATSSPGVVQQTVWFSPAGYTANVGDSIVTPIHLDSKGNMVAAYGFKVAYPYDVVHVDTSIGTSGVKAGSDGFVTAVNANVNGTLAISGFDVEGKGPGTDLDLIRINWKAIAVGSATLQLTVATLVDLQTNSLEKPDLVTAQIDVY
jgi:hypothetical protein